MSDMEPHLLRAALSHRDMLRSMLANSLSKLDFMPKYDGKPVGMSSLEKMIGLGFSENT